MSMQTASQHTHMSTCKGRGVALGFVPASNHSEKALCQPSRSFVQRGSICYGERESKGSSPSLVILEWVFPPSLASENNQHSKLHK